MKKSIRVIAALLIVATFLTSGCGEDIITEAESATAKIPESIAELTLPDIETTQAAGLPEGYTYSFLTGLPISEEVAKLRPLGFQIDNERKARPQCGISAADVVYEVPIEANEVRLTAIFQDISSLDRIGPLRSCRSYHPGILAEYDGILVHNGHSKYALEKLNSSNCDDIEVVNKDYDAQFTSSDHLTGHNNFTNQAKIEKRIEYRKFRREVAEDFSYKFKFAEEGSPNLLENGRTANKVTTGFTQNRSYFVYNSEDGLYYRYAWGEEHKDGDTGLQLAVKNIIIQYCTYHLEDDHKNKYINTVGTGKGAFVTNGKVVDITWEKESYWGNTHYYYDDGTEIRLNPGKSWVCIVLPKMTGESVFE
ncbi:MAG: DUF3048 domain-containing protein [Lachnospiraceae bacterium]|nr:DUF3048 domain-containing protein [Lachnospiraceae bacterium]